jgi:hypothetical protein
MIIWSGLGFLVLVIVLVSSFALNLAFDALAGNGYYGQHEWPFALSLLVAAVVCWFLGSALNGRGSRTVVDKLTGQEFDLNRSNHSLFFIPMHIWAPILAVIGLVVLLKDLLSH